MSTATNTGSAVIESEENIDFALMAKEADLRFEISALKAQLAARESELALLGQKKPESAKQEVLPELRESQVPEVLAKPELPAVIPQAEGRGLAPVIPAAQQEAVPVKKEVPVGWVPVRVERPKAGEVVYTNEQKILAKQGQDYFESLAN